MWHLNTFGIGTKQGLTHMGWNNIFLKIIIERDKQPWAGQLVNRSLIKSSRLESNNKKQGHDLAVNKTVLRTVMQKLHQQNLISFPFPPQLFPLLQPHGEAKLTFPPPCIPPRGDLVLGFRQRRGLSHRRRAKLHERGKRGKQRRR